LIGTLKEMAVEAVGMAELDEWQESGGLGIGLANGGGIVNRIHAFWAVFGVLIFPYVFKLR
jgi:hypothetical protein